MNNTNKAPVVITDDLTREEVHLRQLMRFWIIIFAGGGLLFLFLGERVIHLGNEFSIRLGLSAPLMPVSEEKFWLSLTVSLMTTLTALCYYIQKDIVRNKVLTSFILISKFVSTATFLGFYFFQKRYFGYLMGSVFCDGIIFVITFIFYRRALLSRTPPCALRKPAQP